MNTRYHVSLDVADRAGVLSAVASVFAEHDVSIAAVRQSGRGTDASLVIVTHSAPDAALRFHCGQGGRAAGGTRRRQRDAGRR